MEISRKLLEDVHDIIEAYIEIIDQEFGKSEDNVKKTLSEVDELLNKED